MLKYFLSTLEYLAVCGILEGMILAYAGKRWDRIGRRIVAAASGGALLCAIVMAYMKNKTKLIDTGKWNLYIFGISLLALVLLLILDNRRFREAKAAPYILSGLLAVLAFMQIFYSLPDVLAYPYTIALGGEAVISTGFLYRFIGIVLAYVLVIVMMMAAYDVCVRIRTERAGLMLKIALIITAIQQIAKILQTFYTRRIFTAKWIFPVVKFTSNHSGLFIYGAILAVLFLPIALWIESFHVNEPYRNPAEHRKIKARWRSIRRWSTTLLVCLLLTFVSLTAVKAYAERPVELSAAEECEQRGDDLYVSFEQVEDGHLHRFAYTTDDGVTVRFIIIKKPNSSAYGVGLDACDICGETGYYERNGQVVCNRCDVVMNVNTIGFKGGCNPKVIDYSIDNGFIIVPTSTLVEHEADFK